MLTVSLGQSVVGIIINLLSSLNLKYFGASKNFEVLPNPNFLKNCLKSNKFFKFLSLKCFKLGLF